MKITKKQPAQSGILVNDYLPPATTYLTTASTRPVTYPSSTPSPTPSPPSLHPNTIPTNTYIPTKIADTYLPASKNHIFLASTLAPPPLSDNELHSTPIAIYTPSTTSTARPHPQVDYGPPIAVYPHAEPFSPSLPDHGPVVAVTPRPIPALNNWLEPPRGNSLVSENDDQGKYHQSRPVVRTSTPKPFTAIAGVPLFNRNQYTESRFPLYDGVSVTKNGFRYYLPRQYQEEETYGDNEKAGSYGYIDPFGIRRVVYYNAGGSGKGFVVRKNNRYVGFDATPYDPRPSLR